MQRMFTTTSNRSYRLLPVFLAMVLVLTACQPALLPPLGRTALVLDTVVTITLYDDSADEAVLADAFAQIEQYEALFSRTRADSDIVRLNQAGGMPIEVDSLTAAVLTAACEWAERSDGAFDPTIGAVSALWDFHGETAVLPDSDKLAEGLETVGWRGLHIEGTRAWLENSAAMVDLGGIAKGYIAAQLAEFLRGRGVHAAMLDLGGDVYVLGDNRRVGIRNPHDSAQLAVTVSVSNQAVVSSGNYERGFVLDGRRYHHLLDPETGFPADTGLASVTIISSNPIAADALSTACFIMGLERAVALVDTIPEVEGVFIGADGEVHITAGVVTVR